MTGEVWSEAENDAIVADYFAMLADDTAGRPYSKADHRRALQRRIGRGRGAIEYKHQNVSAVLIAMGEDWIRGYKPAFNYQAALEDAVARWLGVHPDWLERVPTGGDALAPVGLAERAPMEIGIPPTLRNELPPKGAERAAATARRFDVAGRDARNRALGKAGEECVFLHERSTLVTAGRADLAEHVRWVARDEGDGAGYDMQSFEPSGAERLIEVKTTNGWERAPFHITRNELAVSEANRDTWRLMRLWNFSRVPRAFELMAPLERHVELTPTSFQASWSK